MRSVLLAVPRVLLGMWLVGGCAAAPEAHDPRGSRYLYVWASDADKQESDFLAVLDIAPASPRYGEVIATVPVGATDLMAHHTEFTLPESGLLFANAYHARRNYLFDTSAPERPTLAGTSEPAAGLDYPHSFLRLSNGHVLVTYQSGDGSLPGNPGGVAELDGEGRFLRGSSSADPSVGGQPIRTYGLALAPALDRLLTTSSPMHDEPSAHVVQVWRGSDLELLRTITLEPRTDSAHMWPFEPRTLAGGREVILNSYNCGIYHVTELDAAEPRVHLVHLLESTPGVPDRGCGVPLLVGRFFIVPAAYGHAIVTLDVSDPARPVEVARLRTDSTYFPHWLALEPGGQRVVVTDQEEGEPRVLLLTLNTGTGALSVDESFRDPADGRPGVSFRRTRWPHGETGEAVAHGALFRR